MRHIWAIRSHRSLAAGLLLAAMAIAACEADTSPEPTLTPASSEAPPVTASASPSASGDAAGEGAETSVLELEVGDCFSVERTELSTVTVVDCAAEHEYEVFAVLAHEAGPEEPYPGDAQLVDAADLACQPSFEAFVGHEYRTSIWYITSLPPTEPTWAEGDRQIVCTLNQLDATQEPIAVMGSAQGSSE
jgi:Septum formation